MNKQFLTIEPNTTALVKLKDVSKSFGQVQALANASLTLLPSRIHAIAGENGAGKSTLLNVVSGQIVADAGSIWVLGSELNPPTPQEAIRRGVGMVYQHFKLVPTLTALENLMLGTEPTRFGFLQRKLFAQKISTFAETFGLQVSWNALVKDLSVGERQRLEILRVLSRGARVVILDEPTAVLAPADARAVLLLARRLANQGVAIAWVTHKLDEVVEFADEITIMRRGQVVAYHGQGDPVLKNARALAHEALGEIPTFEKAVVSLSTSRNVLEFSSVSTLPHSQLAGESTLQECSFQMKAGQIFGIASVEGNGQRALEWALAGLIPIHSGTIKILDQSVHSRTLRQRRDLGFVWVPSDRHTHGLCSDIPVGDALCEGLFSFLSKSTWWVDETSIQLSFNQAVTDYEIRPNNAEILAGSFSGGNQQKIVVARELNTWVNPNNQSQRSPQVILAAQPTRGVDARAAALIRKQLVHKAQQGAAILLISSDLTELRELSDEIGVLRKGRMVAHFLPNAEIDSIGMAMLGTS